MIGVIGGVGFSEAEIFKGSVKEEIETPHGAVQILVLENMLFLPRHGIDKNVPPHKINHPANIFAFKSKAVDKIIGVNSVGSLKKDIAPPSVVIPHDYISIWSIATYFHDKIVHTIPGLDEGLRQDLISLASKFGLKIRENGVYIQTPGPRLETKAEIRMLASFGDLVGMTMASEADLAKELGLGYASICSVDNYAHGLVSEPLTSENIIQNARTNSAQIADFILKISEEFK
jgi:5'-methylthioadenosine phosphorylase